MSKFPYFVCLQVSFSMFDGCRSVVCTCISTLSSLCVSWSSYIYHSVDQRDSTGRGSGGHGDTGSEYCTYYCSVSVTETTSLKTPTTRRSTLGVFVCLRCLRNLRPYFRFVCLFKMS